jgi:hypothetical protein
MSKLAKRILPILGNDPVLEHSSALVQEYTRKLRGISRQLRTINKEYLAAAQKRFRQSQANLNNQGVFSAASEQSLWRAIVEDFKSRQFEYVKYVHAIYPQARKLAQHVSQLITHGPNSTVVQIELGLRIAELESAIDSAMMSSNSDLISQAP